MRRIILPFIAVLLFLSKTEAQNNLPTSSYLLEEDRPTQVFTHHPFKIQELPGAAGILDQLLGLMGKTNFRGSDFDLVSFRESREGYHYLWNYQFEGAVCEGRYIRLFIDKEWNARQYIYHLEDIEKLSAMPFADVEVIRQKVSDWKFVGGIEKVYVHDQDGWHAYVKVSGVQDLAAFAENWFFDASGEISMVQDNAWRFDAPDSVIQVTVFNPDPITSAKVSYGGDYQDFNDADSPAVNNERVQLPVRVRYENDTFTLIDSFMYFTEIENPLSTQPRLKTPDFNFNRSEQDFEFVNAYFHIHNWVRRVHDFGYPQLPSEAIKIDPHASNGQDVSGFTPAYGGQSLVFGEGGIDDAEDADVLVHELGHALSFSAAPGTTNGLMRTSMEEGTCDYFAMSYSRQISNFGWVKTFNWDGNLTWQGRTVTTNKTFPTDYSNNKYENAEVWVAAWKEVYDSLGPDITDKIAFCALFNQVSNMTFDQMVANCRQCDSIQNNGANSMVIFHAFNRRGMAFPLGFETAQSTEWKLLNSAGFAFRNESLFVDFAGQNITGNVELFDMQGRLIKRFELKDTERFELNAPEIEKGLYLLRVNSDTNLHFTFMINRN